ncbi:hypothetical protein H0A58_08335 [Alcaligenaceae bacterium]|nr:hypothetical protein [Alcaligenaceae bacterium]
MRRALAFTQSPAFSAPLRFFLNVPIFTFLAAGLLLWSGPLALESQWHPVTLALTHLLTLGVLTSAILGALLQILPVATNASIWRPRLTATVVHTLLTLGTFTLVSAFLWGLPILFKLATPLLALAFIWMIAAVVLGLQQHRMSIDPRSAEEILAVRLAIAALFATVVLGVSLAVALGWQWDAPLVLLTHLHSTWGLLGWVGIMIMGISFQVIPVFQVTELYPARLSRWLTPYLFSVLILWTSSMLWLANTSVLIRLLEGLLASICLTYAISTLHLLWTRKRKQADVTTLFWRTAMLSLLAAAAMVLISTITGTLLPVPLGILIIVGVGWSAINGLLYKIIPFLVWYHSQRDLQLALRVVPKVKQIMPDAVGKRQYWVHAAGLTLLLAATIWPVLTRLAAAMLMISAAWLGISISRALLLYRRTHIAIALLMKSA